MMENIEADHTNELPHARRVDSRLKDLRLRRTHNSIIESEWKAEVPIVE
jgi:Mg2+/Co2+ transporter CorC